MRYIHKERLAMYVLKFKAIHLEAEIYQIVLL